ERAPKSGGDGVGLDFAAQIEAARLDPRQLARTGAGQGPRRDELDDRRDSGDRPDSLADLVAKPAALLIAGDPAVDEDGRRLLAARSRDGESSDVAGLEPGQLLDRPFDVLRPMIAPVDDDHVLGAADDEDVALRHIAHVAGVEPTVGAQAGAGRFLVAEVAVHDAGAANEDLSDSAVRQDVAAGRADLDFHPGHRPAAIDHRAKAPRLVRFARGAARELILLDQLDPDSLARRHQRDGERRFGETVAGAEGAGLETRGGETVDERL